MQEQHLFTVLGAQAVYEGSPLYDAAVSVIFSPAHGIHVAVGVVTVDDNELRPA